MATLVRIGLAIGRSFAYDRGILRGISRYAEARPDWSFVSVILEQQPLRALGRRRPDALQHRQHDQGTVRVGQDRFGP